MSRRGNCYVNALAENFFSILKSEWINRCKPSAFAQARKLMDEFIYFYNHERSKPKRVLLHWKKGARLRNLALFYAGGFLAVCFS